MSHVPSNGWSGELGRPHYQKVPEVAAWQKTSTKLSETDVLANLINTSVFTGITLVGSSYRGGPTYSTDQIIVYRYTTDSGKQ